MEFPFNVEAVIGSENSNKRIVIIMGENLKRRGPSG